MIYFFGRGPDAAIEDGHWLAYIKKIHEDHNIKVLMDRKK